MTPNATPETFLLLADAVAPMSGPIIRQAYILIDRGRVAAVGQQADLPPLDLPRRRAGPGLITPGLINAHTHSNLSFLASRFDPEPFWHWLPRLVQARLDLGTIQQRQHAEAAGAREAILQALARGTTCLADMHYIDAVRDHLADIPARMIHACEALALDFFNFPAWINAATGPAYRGPRSLPALAPHAPYSVPLPWIQKASQAAIHYDIPLMIHLAETPEEIHWLQHGDGPVARYAQKLIEPPSPPRTGPLDYARQAGLIDAGAMLIHATCLSPEEIVQLAQWTEQIDQSNHATLQQHNAQLPPALSGATPRPPLKPLPSVCYCPRSTEFLGQPNHPWKQLLQHNVNVCLGTDSLASLPRGATLAIIEEMRFLRRKHPDVQPFSIMLMATANAAEALRLNGQLGMIEPPCYADLVLWPIDPAAPDPLADLLDCDLPPSCVYISGTPLQGLPVPS